MIEGNTSVVAQAGSALPRSKAAKQQFMFDMWDRQLETDPRKVKEMLELGGGEPEEFELDLNEAEAENSLLNQGQAVEALMWQNHAAHHYQHRREMKSADWREKPPEIQQAYIEHDAQHSQHEDDLRQKQAEQDALAAALGGGGSPNGQLPVGENGQTGQAAPPFQSSETPRSLVDEQPQ
jgi:hypothetical protein